MGPSSNQNKSDDNSERMQLAERLRKEREYLGLSQDQVAKHLGISRSALSNIEAAQRKVGAVELKRLAALFQKPLTYFTGDPGPPSDALPADLEHLAREAKKLTPKDRAELARFADFLRQRSGSSDDGATGES